MIHDDYQINQYLNDHLNDHLNQLSKLDERICASCEAKKRRGHGANLEAVLQWLRTGEWSKIVVTSGEKPCKNHVKYGWVQNYGYRMAHDDGG